MRLLLTRKKPLQLKQDEFFDAFEEYSNSAQSIDISTGYVSVESIRFLLENVKASTLPHIDLAIGMHAFDGFTKTQYDAAMNLADELKKSNTGSASICISFPFHGKIFAFHKNGKPFAAIIGSSNLSGLCPGSPNVEVDAAIEDPKFLEELSAFQKQLRGKACEPLENWNPKRFIQNNVLVGAERLNPKEAGKFWSLKQLTEFSIPLKAELKSNLNACFGKGRENKRKKLIRPRPWYEVELVVPSIITALPEYPRQQSFKTITDDGWSFNCKTSGDYSKNFRSENDLSILGTWIKGRLESAGLLKIGELVNEDMLRRYGKDHIKLIKTEDPEIWLLEFDSTKE